MRNDLNWLVAENVERSRLSLASPQSEPGCQIRQEEMARPLHPENPCYGKLGISLNWSSTMKREV